MEPLLKKDEQLKKEIEDRINVLNSVKNYDSHNVAGVGRKITENYLTSRHGLICQVSTRLFSHFQKTMIKIFFLLIHHTMNLNISVKSFHEQTLQYIKLPFKKSYTKHNDIRHIDIFGDQMNLPELQHNCKHDVDEKKREKKEKEKEQKERVMFEKKRKRALEKDEKKKAARMKTMSNQDQYQIKRELNKEREMLQEQIKLATQKYNDKRKEEKNRTLLIEINEEIKIIESKLQKILSTLHQYSPTSSIFELSENCVKSKIGNAIFCNVDSNCDYCLSMKHFLLNFHSKQCENNHCLFPKCEECKQFLMERKKTK